MAQSVLKEKSYLFAVEIVKAIKQIQGSKKEFILSKQLLRNGTSVGANIREAEFAQSGPDFIHKLSISLKEANETSYWLDLLKDTDYMDKDMHVSLSRMYEELLRMLVSSINTMKRKK